MEKYGKRAWRNKGKTLGEILERGLGQAKGNPKEENRGNVSSKTGQQNSNFNRKETYLNRRSERNVGRVISDQTDS